MHPNELHQRAAGRPRLRVDPLAAARAVTWTLIGGLLLFFYFGVS